MDSARRPSAAAMDGNDAAAASSTSCAVRSDIAARDCGLGHGKFSGNLFAWPRYGIGGNAQLLAGWAGRSDRASGKFAGQLRRRARYLGRGRELDLLRRQKRRRHLVAPFAAAHRRRDDRRPNSRRQPVAARQTSMNAYEAPAKPSRRPFICTAGPACISVWPAAAPHAAEAAAALHAASASQVSPRAPAPAWAAAGLVGERRVVAACEPRLTGWDAVSAK